MSPAFTRIPMSFLKQEGTARSIIDAIELQPQLYFVRMSYTCDLFASGSGSQEHVSGVCWLQVPVTHQANLKKRGTCFKALEVEKKRGPSGQGKKTQLDFWLNRKQSKRCQYDSPLQTCFLCFQIIQWEICLPTPPKHMTQFQLPRERLKIPNHSNFQIPEKRISLTQLESGVPLPENNHGQLTGDVIHQETASVDQD